MRSRFLALAGVLAGTLLLAACGGGTSTTAGTGASSSSPPVSSSADFNAADVTFAQSMRPHHAQAVEMAQMVLAKNPPAQVAALAKKIQAAQSPEIQQIDGMLAHFGTTSASSAMPGMDHGGSPTASMDPAMPMPSGSSMPSGTTGGMMSAQQMAQLQQAADGVPAAKVFLQLMQEHHQGAIAMAGTEIANGKYQPAVTMAKNIRDSQTAEVAQIQQLLTQL